MPQRWTTFFAAAVLVVATAVVGNAQQQSTEELLEELREAIEGLDSVVLMAMAENGNAAAQVNLGVMYANGQGVPEDDAEAVRWYRGISYGNGEGVPQDFVQAHKWFNLAASRGSGENRESAVRNRDLIAQQMTAAQIAEAQRLAREWDEAHPRD